MAGVGKLQARGRFEKYFEIERSIDIDWLGRLHWLALGSLCPPWIYPSAVVTKMATDLGCILFGASGGSRAAPARDSSRCLWVSRWIA